MSDLLNTLPRQSVYMRTHARLDRGFARWAAFSLRHPWWIILCWVLFAGGLGTQIRHIAIDTSAEGFVHEDDPARLAYNDFRHQFGRDERMLLIVENPDGDIFTQPFLDRLRALHRDLETEVPLVQAVDSLINARLTYGEDDTLIVRDFLEDWPDNEAALATLKARALANPTYRNQFLSADGRYAILMIRNDTYSREGQAPVDALAGFDDLETLATVTSTTHPPFLSGEENTAIVLATEAVAERYQANDFRIQFAGTPFMVDQLSRLLMQDMARFLLLSVLIIMALLALAFRRVVMVFLPMTVAVLATVGTLGSMGLIGMPIDGAVQIMPSFLITVSIGSSVHIFTLFFQAMQRGASKHDALVYALEHCGTAILMTGITTIVGLASFIPSAIRPVSNFGIITPIGVANTLLASLTLLPALIAVTPIGKTPAARPEHRPFSQRLLTACGNLAIRYPWQVIACWMLLIFSALGLMTQMRLSHSPTHWFPAEHPLRIATELLNDELGGGMFMEVLVDTGRENGIKEPALLQRIERVTEATMQLHHNDVHAGKITSIVDIVKETNQALHANDPAFYAIPDDRALVAQELLLFENSGSDDLVQLVDSQFSKARITIKLPFIDAVNYPGYLDRFEPMVRDIIGDQAEVTVTGLLVVTGKIIYGVMISMTRSYGLSIVLISLLMVLFMGSLRVGLLSMLSNVTPIVITLGFMVLLGMPMDAFTLLIGSIALGLAVDDTIHFMKNFIRYLHRYQDPDRAVHSTLATAGQAMWFTSLTLTAGFIIFMFATMENLFNFGMLTAFCIVMALLADILLNPAVMVVYGRHKLRQQAASR